MVVDDGSTDRTAAPGPSGRCPGRLASLQSGVGAAHQTAYIFALRHGYEICGQLDGDSQHPASEVTRLIAAVEAGADLAVGSRFADDINLNISRIQVDLRPADRPAAVQPAGLDLDPADLHRHDQRHAGP